MIKYQKDSDNIAILQLDMAERSLNIINHKIIASFKPVIEHLKEQRRQLKLKGVIITSAKSNFLEGGDLEYLYQASSPEAIFQFTNTLKQLFRDLEQPGVPVVAAINGTALGIGFELALACHHRIVIDHPKVKVGLPEVSLGLMPSGGSVLRLMWLFGIEKAFELLTAGRRYTPREAKVAKIVDEVVQNRKQLLDRAKDWLLNAEDSHRPWDSGKSIPQPSTSSQDEIIQRLNAQLIREKHRQYPAEHAILNVMAECKNLDFDTASKVESRHYTYLVQKKEVKNMIRAFWYDYHAIQKGKGRPKGFGRFRPKRIGVIGAGQMGCGIATSCAINGMEVVLKDISKVIAERGKYIVEQYVDDLIAANKVAAEDRAAILSRVTTTDKAENFETCDLVLEAVFENANLKQRIVRQTEAHLDEYTFIGSNTISIPISKLAEAAERPAHFVGIHFFPPAHHIPMLEIVKGKKTSDETIARAYDFASAIRKIPIVVKDSWGFYAARVLNTYILESITMLLEGYAPALIENLGVAAGMPKGGLAIADELGLPLILNYERQAAEHYGTKYIQHPAVEVLTKMTQTLDRKGKAHQQGFYDYGTAQNLSPALLEHFPTTQLTYDRVELIDRFLIAQVIEAGWCLQEKVIRSVEEANLGSIYGWGFPAYKGGVIQYINDFGKIAFLERCRNFETKFGQRFKVPKYLLKLEVD